MSLQYNPRFTLRQARFHALSCSQLCDFLKNLNYASNKDDDKVLIEDAWQDLLDSLYDGSLIRWLKQLGEDDSKIKEIGGVLKPFVVSGTILMDLVDKLFDDIPEKISEFLGKKIDAEKKLKSDKIIPKKDLILKLNNSVCMEMVWVETNVKEKVNEEFIIKPYDFHMGSDDIESLPWERPVHKVHFTNGYWIGKYPITQKQWDAMGGEPKSLSPFRGGKGGSKTNPVKSVSWENTNSFCEQLNSFFTPQLDELNNKNDKITVKYKFALPTEAQWEFAARGGIKSKGYKYSGSNDINEVAWYYENSGKQYVDNNKWDFNKLHDNNCSIHPVGLKKPNELGIHDMSGNVWEWCRDCCKWDDKKGMVVTDTYKEGIKDPCCKVGSYRVIRGGSWFNPARDCRPSFRDCGDPTHRNGSFGFRVALVPVH